MTNLAWCEERYPSVTINVIPGKLQVFPAVCCVVNIQLIMKVTAENSKLLRETLSLSKGISSGQCTEK